MTAINIPVALRALVDGTAYVLPCVALPNKLWTPLVDPSTAAGKADQIYRAIPVSHNNNKLHATARE